MQRYWLILKLQKKKQKQKQKQKKKKKKKQETKNKTKQKTKKQKTKTKQKKKKKNNDIQRSVPLHSKTIIPYELPCFEDPYCSDISDVVLQINDFTASYQRVFTHKKSYG